MNARNFSPMKKAVVAVFPLLVAGACTHTSIQVETSCAGIDWYETGRTDGVNGTPIAKLAEYRKRCDASQAPVNVDAYSNGREAGLSEYCTTAQGMSAGRSGQSYSHVCPPQLEPAFLQGYEAGRRIRTLESADNDLHMRVDHLLQLMSEHQGGANVQSQIDLLRGRRDEISNEISKLESDPNQSSQ